MQIVIFTALHNQKSSTISNHIKFRPSIYISALCAFFPLIGILFKWAGVKSCLNLSFGV